MPLRLTVMGIRGRLNSIVRFGRRATKFGQTKLGQIVAEPWYMNVQGFGPFI
jgi:hypothetical protein